MRHAKKGKKIGHDGKHRKALLRNLAKQLFEHGAIKTTHTKARELRPYAEKLITMSKKNDLNARRLLLSEINNKDIVHKMFTEISEKYKDRSGGYTRIVKLGARQGDGAPVSLIQLV